jgi:hypothetical protein
VTPGRTGLLSEMAISFWQFADKDIPEAFID